MKIRKRWVVADANVDLGWFALSYHWTKLGAQMSPGGLRVMTRAEMARRNVRHAQLKQGLDLLSAAITGASDRNVRHAQLMQGLDLLSASITGVSE